MQLCKIFGSFGPGSVESTQDGTLVKFYRYKTSSMPIFSTTTSTLYSMTMILCEKFHCNRIIICPEVEI